MDRRASFVLAKMAAVDSVRGGGTSAFRLAELYEDGGYLFMTRKWEVIGPINFVGDTMDRTMGVSMPLLMRRLAQDLRRLADLVEAVIEEGEEKKNWKEEKVWQPGMRVRIVRTDYYHGMIGTLVSRRGKQFWNLRVWDSREKCVKLIYKKETSLQLVGLGDDE